MDEIVRAKKPVRVPVVLTQDEVAAVLGSLSGVPRIMANLLYGSGLRLMECVRLRVKDIDFSYHQITVRQGKGMKDRVTMLPCIIQTELKHQLETAKQLHDRDLNEGFGQVYLPFALERKYPNANREWGWQYVFPAAKRSRDPRSGVVRRHHVHKQVLQRAVKQATRRAEISKPVSCHTFRHYSVLRIMPIMPISALKALVCHPFVRSWR